MKQNIAIICLSLLVSLLLATPSYAEGYWRKKANELLETAKEEQKQNLSPDTLGKEEIAKAFKQALSIGAEQVVARLGKLDGFNTDPLIRILVPKELQKAKKLLKKVGKEKYANDLELRLNRAAELATPKARKLFLGAVKNMSFDDIMAIYKGPEDSATRYFVKTMSPGLEKAMRPIVDNSLSEVKAARSYKKLVRRYNKLPFTKKIESDLTAHVVEKGMAGIFHYMAKEEAAIRKDPVKQTTDLLKKVFGKN
ncbi:MAG: DUF4197 domain-containing protein [Proteobacteria bacterium]|nr:DUF4197 domain-containing protein [Pseudomonadota bacterium]